MKPDQSIAIMKALADQSRLNIIKSLLERPQYVEEIASRHGLAASTVSFHLRKLEQAGLVTSRKEQYYAVFEANQGMLDTTLREIVADIPVGRELQDTRMEEYRRKVLETFFRHGRLEKLPAQHKKRLIVLEQFAARFETDRRYDEQQVTSLIGPLFDDYCTIRRLLVDEGLIRRDGAAYWREGAPLRSDLPATAQVQPRAAQQTERERRTTMKQAYRQRPLQMGIYQIRNTQNNRVYVGSSENMEGARTSRMFQLRMGKAIFSSELQRDLERQGAATFEFSVLEVLTPPVGKPAEQALADLHLQWLETLQPFGERGYNSARAFQRERDRRQFTVGPQKND
ncbi:metalloregulator ArsR/SmtB family transcription factor [Geobacter sp. SVR]|uniref:metalloregulator ArsR/SmtB family transcription factor n=1 Tax=Geobacter sp. SVR TaxID=2495594 RepID=UPI00143F01D4|nr:metalloregulator ArsR/SmtB family transcription factor [Geobacter sp. SVR]BCS55393.1 hypothetical protein GSVR_37010 [Geobacter sp. SVR]GCF87316.1 hypothetical protein GSbR_39160 [Geobacter sp. SVR]